ncbi:MAG: hypothetical protein HOQ01_06100 [Lysobacter sp.]|nr:hypothetical protein [Lysobacter sp.]
MRDAPRESDRLSSAIEESRALRRHTGELIAGARKQLESPPDIDAVMREALLVRARASLNVAASRRVHYDPGAY